MRGMPTGTRSRSLIVFAVLTGGAFAALIGPLAPPARAYTTPGSGVTWTFDDLVANSSGAIVLLSPGVYALTQDLTISGPDTVLASGGQTLRVDPGFGIDVTGTLRAPGGGGWAAFESNASTPAAGDWTGLRVLGTLDVDTVRIEHAQRAIGASGSAVISFRYGWIGNSYPDTVLVSGAQSVLLANSTIWGGSPPVGAGGDAVSLSGTVAATVTLAGNSIFGGNGTTGSGGDAVLANTLDGALQVLDNGILQGGLGAASLVPGGAGSPGGAGLRITPVANVAGTSVNVSGNQEIRGGNGGEFIGTDGVGGNGGPGVNVLDTDSTGAVLIERNAIVSGGNGGGFSGTTAVAATITGSGGNGIFLSGLNSPRLRSIVSYGGNGGSSSGSVSTTVVPSRTGAGGTALRATAPGLQGTDLVLYGGSAGNSFGSGNITGGTGGIGLWLSGSGGVTVDNLATTGGFGGGDVLAVAGSNSGGGGGGAGVFLTGSAITLTNPTVTGGTGGAQAGAGTMGAGAGAPGISGAATGSLIVGGGTVTGGRGGPHTNATTSLVAGGGGLAVSLSGLATVTLDGAILQGGSGGDNSGPGAAGNGGGGVFIDSASNAVQVVNAPAISVGAGGQAPGPGTAGLLGLNALEFGAAVSNLLVQGSALTSAGSRLLQTNSPITARDNAFSGGPAGIFMNSASNSVFTNNTFATAFAAIVCSGGTNITATATTVTLGAYLVHASFCGMSVREAVAAAAVGLLGQSDTTLLVVNATLGAGGVVTSNLNTNVTFLNTTFDPSGLSVSGGSRLIVQNFLAVRTEDTAGSGLAGSDVEVRDNGAPLYATAGFGGTDAATGITGEVGWIVVTDRIYDNSNTATENATDVQVSAPPYSFLNNPRSVDMSASHTERFTPPDSLPPLTLNVLLDGQGTRRVGDNILVALTATIDDTGTNGSRIASANYTMGAGNWASAQPMPASDGAFDTPSESVNATLDSSAFPSGTTSVCIYGTDAAGNGDTAGACAALEVDRSAPTVQALRVNGAMTPADLHPAGPFNFTATVDDALSGAGSILGGAALWNGFPLGPVTPVDGAFDEASEDVYYLYPGTGTEGTSHMLCIDGADDVGNNASACGVFRMLAPPAIPFVRINGSMSWVALLGTTVNVTTQITDVADGASPIASANLTVDPANWGSSQALLATDGAFDGVNEFAHLVLDTTSIPLGTHSLCVYATDAAGATNLTGACATLTVLATDSVPPTFTDLRLENTQGFLSWLHGETVGIYAVASDVGLGDSNIASANLTVDGDWASALTLNAADGAFDEPAEDLTGTLFTGALSVGLHTVCVSATDARGNANLTGTCMTLELTDPFPPRVGGVTADGAAAITVTQGASVQIRGHLDDFDSPIAPRGTSDIASANFTLDGSWAGATAMTAEDLLFDDFFEWVVGTLDTAGLAAGAHTVCVNGADVAGNENTSQAACASVTVLVGGDPLPPEITALTLELAGQGPVPGPLTIHRGKVVLVAAVASDLLTGGTAIASARLVWDGDAFALTATDGAFDEVTEDVRYLGLPTWNRTLGAHALCVYAADAVGNANTTGLCTTITLTDLVPPGSFLTRLSGAADLAAVRGTLVNVTALVDDTTGGDGRGFSPIASANFTRDGDWAAAIGLAPLDGVFDGPAEWVYGVWDTTGLPLGGPYLLCVYGTDDQGNGNTTASGEGCATLTLLASDTLPPRVTSLALEGAEADLAVVQGAAISIRAGVDDSPTGGTAIASANFTLDGDWATATGLSAEDGAFDEAFEWVSLGAFATVGLSLGPHLLCVYAADALGNGNRTGFCRTLTMNAAPSALDVNHTAATQGTVGAAIPISFTVSGGAGAVTATVYFQAPGAPTFSQTPATCAGGTCTAEIPAPGAAGALRYYLEVTDGTRAVRDPATGDHAVTIAAAPEGIPAWVFGVIALLAVMSVILLVLLLRRRRRAETEEPTTEAPAEVPTVEETAEGDEALSEEAAEGETGEAEDADREKTA